MTNREPDLVPGLEEVGVAGLLVRRCGEDGPVLSRIHILQHVDPDSVRLGYFEWIRIPSILKESYPV